MVEERTYAQSDGVSSPSQDFPRQCLARSRLWDPQSFSFGLQGSSWVYKRHIGGILTNPRRRQRSWALAPIVSAALLLARRQIRRPAALGYLVAKSRLGKGDPMPGRSCSWRSHVIPRRVLQGCDPSIFPGSRSRLSGYMTGSISCKLEFGERVRLRS